MKKDIILNNPRFLGDILFITPIIKFFENKGYNVILPVEQRYLEYQPYLEINMIDMKDCRINYDVKKIVETDKAIIYPLSWANGIESGGSGIESNAMIDKYRMLNIPIGYWRKLKWKRFENKENSLFNLLKLENKKYNLINENYSMKFKRKIVVNNGLENVYMNIVNGYNLLDWCKVIENAEYIHTVGTSLSFILENMELKNDYYLYKRLIDDIKNYDYLFYKVKEIIP